MKDNYIERVAVWCFLHLANIGVNWVEVVAQWIASVIVSEGSGDVGVSYREAWREIDNRVITLMADQSEIWDGLLPGGASQVTVDDFTLTETEPLSKLDAVRCSAWLELDDGEGYCCLSANHPGIHRLDTHDDLYWYSIIVHPEIRHDEASDLIRDAQKVEGESPLNLWREIYKDIDMLDKMGRWPAEELCGWITHLKSQKSYIMTWDQAVVLKALHDAEDVIDRNGGDVPDFSDYYQGISDQMTIEGQEYKRG